MLAVSEIVKSLGSSIEKTRDAAFVKYKELLRGDTSDWQELDYRGLWKGLFYGMWNLDGEIRQLEMARSIGETLIDEEINLETGISFWKAFLRILKEEWIMVDQHRLDKYYALARSMLHHTFRKLLRLQWNEVRFMSELESEIMSSVNIMSSLPAHFIEIYFEELKKACHKENNVQINQKALVVLLYPFEKLSKSTSARHARLKPKIKELVFEQFLHEEDDGIISLKTVEAFKKIMKLMDLGDKCDFNLSQEGLAEVDSDAKETREKILELKINVENLKEIVGIGDKRLRQKRKKQRV